MRPIDRRFADANYILPQLFAVDVGPGIVSLKYRYRELRRSIDYFREFPVKCLHRILSLESFVPPPQNQARL